ncbi:TPA: type II toxin-antitoxin system toxin [Bacillus thuringiensis]|uniref:Immunity protein BC_0921 n=12 Tax=Bacillus cereus group TaxID=86661 RepID=ATOX1_BACCR|nr:MULTISPECIES: type II toxin-antitoxin system toxin [Bacillus]Q81H98.1 RecName: Full=Immunity protein BC_0921 [Bacillus cereus ATCC 14579]MBJ6722562.1 type II toxin-antitoxin system toxin [Bacillus sp. PR5]MCO4216958.1 type II toxin-antitoxin system toxin [Bacillus sp. 10017]MDM5374133.1 type II toxin-antitoxin system toxin [Bacillus bombysepticus]NIE93975.1 type II toxin-antitoxin system toxin [Bacillus sp. Ab-1751]CKG89168.1 Uncharacterised protein [Streptococcus pneumoniae]
MKYPYSFEVLTNGKLVMRLPQEIKLMETFLGVEVSAFGDWILEEIHSVLNGKENYVVVNGNICGLEIRKDTTTVLDNLAEDGKGDFCEIETIELVDLIHIWQDKQKEFKKGKNKELK